jgi:L-2-hydroxyglutarate oxidase LhgO
LDRVDCVVIGAGVIGLAVARALALAGREVVVVEAAEAIGTATSSRNSEVIHAGIYYAAGSLKAALCVEGRKRLYAFCEAHGVPYRRLGKLIVATEPDQLATLEALKARAEANGVDDLRRLDRDEVLALEPDLRAAGGLLSPSTGVVDSHAFMLALQGDAEAAGAALALRTPVLGGRLVPGVGIELEFGGASPFELAATFAVNAAGLEAHRVAAAISGLPSNAVPSVGFAKGNYFALSGKSPFVRLVYPVPMAGGLGVHLTLDLAGRARFGPDVEWIGTIDYTVDPHRAEPFYAAIRRYWPALPDGALNPDYCGIRVKLDGAASPDFRIERPLGGGLINLFGFESPGLTAALAVGERVRHLISG